MHPTTLLAAAIVLVSFLLYLFLADLARRNAKCNPRGLTGPALVPWIGRVHDPPIQYMWLKFNEWSDTYRPRYRTKILGSNFIIVLDETIAEELLVKRAKIYLDRPMVRWLFDSTSTYGSTEYFPLMGKNCK